MLVAIGRFAVCLLESCDCLLNVVTRAKRGDAYKAVSRRPKSAPWGGHNVTIVQDLCKYIPGVLAWESNPDVGCIYPSIHCEAHLHKCVS